MGAGEIRRRLNCEGELRPCMSVFQHPASLHHLMRTVENGDAVLVTIHGRPTAMLGPVTEDDLEDVLLPRAPNFGRKSKLASATSRRAGPCPCPIMRHTGPTERNVLAAAPAQGEVRAITATGSLLADHDPAVAPSGSRSWTPNASRGGRCDGCRRHRARSSLRPVLHPVAERETLPCRSAVRGRAGRMGLHDGGHVTLAMSLSLCQVEGHKLGRCVMPETPRQSAGLPPAAVPQA